MDLTLTLTKDLDDGEQVVVVFCNGEKSHSFALAEVGRNPGSPGNDAEILRDPYAFGRKLYNALFLPGSFAETALESETERIVLTSIEYELDAIPWEYACGPNGFLALDLPFVRGLLATQRIAAPELNKPLHILAVASHPLDEQLPALNVEGEWLRLIEIIQGLSYAVTLEPCLPPTVERLTQLAAKYRNCVIHFMGHGSQEEQDTVLYFETEWGGPQQIHASDFGQAIGDTAFLVILNACASASPGKTQFANLALALAQRKVPYALGMRFAIADQDALTFTRMVYGELVHGVPVEKAVFQARRSLARNSSRPWVVGVPVLYTSLQTPALGFAITAGKPVIIENKPPVDIGALHQFEGVFQGRDEELRTLGQALTGDQRAKIVTILGSAGQGKTALARQAVERFAFAWPGGVWAVSLAELPAAEQFMRELATFLRISPLEMRQAGETEQRQYEKTVLSYLNRKRTLVVLDNAENLIDKVKAGEEKALGLALQIRRLYGPTVSILATSRLPLDWVGEQLVELEGLSPEEGARLFQQSALQKSVTYSSAFQQLSQKVDGHHENEPIEMNNATSLGESQTTDLPNPVFKEEKELLKNSPHDISQRKDEGISLYQTGMDYLDNKNLELAIKHLEEAAFAFAETQDPIKQAFAWSNCAYAYWLSQNLDKAIELNVKALQEFRKEGLKDQEFRTLNNIATLHVSLGQTRNACEAYEQAIFLCRERGEIEEEGSTIIHLADIYNDTDQWDYALDAYQQALIIYKQLDNKVREAYTNGKIGILYASKGYFKEALEPVLFAEKTLVELGAKHDAARMQGNLSGIYLNLKQLDNAIKYSEHALSTLRETDDHLGEAQVLRTKAIACREGKQYKEAIYCFEQSLSIQRELGNPSEVGDLLISLGKVYEELGDFDRSIRNLDSARLVFQESSDIFNQARTLEAMARNHIRLRQLKDAEMHYKKALDLRRELGNKHDEVKVLSELAGLCLHDEQPMQALHYFTEAWADIAKFDDKNLMANMLRTRAGLGKYIGDFSMVLESLQLALEIFKDTGEKYGEATTYYELGSVFRQKHNFENAEKNLKYSLSIFDELEDASGRAAVLYSLAVIQLQDRQQKGQALVLLKQAEELLKTYNLTADFAGHSISNYKDDIEYLENNVDS